MVILQDSDDQNSPVQQLRKSAETSLVRSGRINDLINNALGYLEHCRQDLPTGLTEAAYINYWHAYLLLFEVIPNHEEYQGFSNKKSSAFFQSYLELRKIVENEGYVEELERYLNNKPKNNGGFEYSGKKKNMTNGKSNHVKRKSVINTSVATSSGTPEPSDEDSKKDNTSIVVQNGSSEDPLESRFRKLRFNDSRQGKQTPSLSSISSSSSSSSSLRLNSGHTSSNHIDPMISKHGLASTSGSSNNPSAPMVAPPPPPTSSSHNNNYLHNQINGKGSQYARPSGPRINPSIIFPKTTIVNSETLAKYLQYIPDSILLLDVRDRREFDRGHIAAPNIVCIEPITLRQNLNDEGLEDTLILAPEKEQEIFSNRNRFDIVIMYDSDSRSNSYRGGPTNDAQAKILFYLTTAIYDYAFSKPLKRPPCLLVGGFESWVDDFEGKHISQSSTAPQSTEIQSPTVPQEIPSRPYGSRKGSTASIHNSGTNGYARDLNDFFRSPPPPHAPQQSPSIGVAPMVEQYQQYRPYQQTNGYVSDSRVTASSNTTTASRSSRLSYQSHSSHSKNANSISSPKPVYSPPNQVQQDNHIPMPGIYATSTLPANATPPPITSSHSSHSSFPSANNLKIISQEFTTGLKNLGNTCYMNSILQCLAGTPTLAVPFVDGSYRKFVNVNSRLGYKGVLAQKFAELVQNMYRETVAYVGPVSLKQLAGQLRDTFQGYEQQDCQEFLTFILDGLHEDLNSNGDKERLKELTETEERRRENMSVRVASTIEWERYLKSDYSLIVDTCQGQYQSRLRCLTCNFTSTTYNVFSFLSLPIPLNHNVVALHDCFDLFTTEEILDGDDAWHCPRCKQPRRTSKRLQISRLPNILIIHLKRFRQRAWARTSDKLETFVTYPVNNLDLTEYWPNYSGDDEHRLSRIPVRGQTAPFRYDLYAVANHYGTLKGGHYTSVVRKGRKGWCYFDDTRITRNVPLESLVNQNAYVLFYERKNILQ